MKTTKEHFEAKKERKSSVFTKDGEKADLLFAFYSGYSSDLYVKAEGKKG